MNIFMKLYIIIPMIVLSLILWKTEFSYRVKTSVISLFSLIIIGILHPVFLAILAVIILLLYYLIKCVGREKLKMGSFLLIGLSLTLLTLLIGKYGPELIASLFGQNGINGFNILIPIGISYFVMKTIQLIIDFRRGIIKDVNLLDMVAFLVFLPTFAAGPVESYNTFKNAYMVEYKKEDYVYGLMRIFLGYFKKMVITDVLISHYISDNLINNFAYGADSFQVLKPFVLVVFTFAKAYFDLSAYSDIAIGFSRLFGFKIVENFNRPFWKKNISEFWKSWHISLSRWCTTNVYFPVFGLTRKIWLGMYASMLVMAMWHDASSLRWIFWGLHHATGLVLFSLFVKFKRKSPKLKKMFNAKVMNLFSHFFTFWYVSIGYAFVGGVNIYDGIDRYVSAITSLPLGLYQLFSYLVSLVL